MNLDIETGTKLIRKAYEERTHDLLMQRWMLNYEREMSFTEFKNKLMAGKIQDHKTKEEILSSVKEILDSFERGE